MKHAFQSFEGEFDLPSQTIHGQDLPGGEHQRQQGRREDDEFGGERAALVERLVFLARQALQPLALGARGFLGLTKNNEARGHRIAGPLDQDVDVVDRPVCLFHVPHVRDEVEFLALGRAQARGTPARSRDIVDVRVPPRALDEAKPRAIA